MRLYAALIGLALMTIATIASFAAKPIEVPTMIDAQSPGVWPKYAAANRVELTDSYACMRLVVPYEVTTGPRKGVVRT